MTNITRARNPADSPTKTCTEADCDRPLRARGLCSTHYNKLVLTQRHKTHDVPCIVCGITVTKMSGGGRKLGNVCSNHCRRILTFGERCELPDDHWARWYGKTSAVYIKRCTTCPNAFASRSNEATRCEHCKTTRRTARFTVGQCHDCGTWFTAETNGSHINYCSTRCLRRVHKRARRAREHHAPGSFRYVEIMRLYMLGNQRCAYCDELFTGLPEPEHVVPLSRGGRNDLGNLLPACRPCNIDKGDATPVEWNARRIAAGLPPIRTNFPVTDSRFKHLVPAQPSRPRWAARPAA